MSKMVEVVTRLKKIDYSKVDDRKKRAFIEMKAKEAGANKTEVIVITETVMQSEESKL